MTREPQLLFQASVMQSNTAGKRASGTSARRISFDPVLRASLNKLHISFGTSL